MLHFQSPWYTAQYTENTNCTAGYFLHVRMVMQVCKTYISYISPYPIGEHCEYTYSSSKYSRYLKLECRISKYYQFYSESLLSILLINFNALYFLSKFLFPQNELISYQMLGYLLCHHLQVKLSHFLCHGG